MNPGNQEGSRPSGGNEALGLANPLGQQLARQLGDVIGVASSSCLQDTPIPVVQLTADQLNKMIAVRIYIAIKGLAPIVPQAPPPHTLARINVNSQMTTQGITRKEIQRDEP